MEEDYIELTIEDIKHYFFHKMLAVGVACDDADLTLTAELVFQFLVDSGIIDEVYEDDEE